MIESPVTELLNSNAIPFDVIEIPLTEDKKPIRNLEELLQSEGRDPHSVVRSLLFKAKSGNFILLAVAGAGRADWATLRQHLGERKLEWQSLMRFRKSQVMSLALSPLSLYLLTSVF